MHAQYDYLHCRCSDPLGEIRGYVLRQQGQ